MREVIGSLIRDLRSADLMQANGAIVRSALLLEWHAQGYLDRSAAEGFPQKGLYDSAPTNEDVVALINQLKACLLDQSFKSELHPTLIWALSESNLVEALQGLLQYVNGVPDIKEVCKRTNILSAIADFFEECEQCAVCTTGLEILQAKMRAISFSEPNLDYDRDRIMNLRPSI